MLYTPDKHDAIGLASAAETLLTKFNLPVQDAVGKRIATTDSASAQDNCVIHLNSVSQRCNDHSLDLAAVEAAEESIFGMVEKKAA